MPDSASSRRTDGHILPPDSSVLTVVVDDDVNDDVEDDWVGVVAAVGASVAAAFTAGGT
jgi:hypothetical protein